MSKFEDAVQYNPPRKYDHVIYKVLVQASDMAGDLHTKVDGLFMENNLTEDRVDELLASIGADYDQIYTALLNVQNIITMRKVEEEEV